MPTSLPERWRHVATVVNTRPLRDFLLGRMFAATGAWIFRVTVGWFIWSATQSPALLGVATFLLLAPQMILAPFSGVIADTRDRRMVLAVTHLANASIKGGIAALALSGLLTAELLLPLLVLVGASGALSQASNKTIVSAFVVEDDLATAVSLNSVIFNLAGFVGPALAGFIIWLGGAGASFAASVAFTVVFIASLRQVPPLPPETRDRRPTMLGDLVEALEVVRTDPLLKPLFLFHLASATLARPFLEFVPAIVGQTFSGGAGEVAQMTSIVGLGSVVGGLWLAQRDNRAGMLPVVVGAMLGLCLTLIALVWSPLWWLALGLGFVAGFGMITRAAAIQSMLQMEAPAGMRGRIVSFYGLILNAGSILGAVVIGLLAELTGVRIALTLSVSGAIAAWLVLRGPLTRAVRARAADRQTALSEATPRPGPTP